MRKFAFSAASMRSIGKCQSVLSRGPEAHSFLYSDCIDKWLTVGSNACPFCRQDGVKRLSETASGEAVETAA